MILDKAYDINKKMNEIANEKLRTTEPNEKSENMKYNFKNFEII